MNNDKIKMVGILGIIGNTFLLIIKGIIGFITGSMGMIADAVNSAGDIFISLMTFIGNKIASKQADEDHNLGHGKAEYIYSLIVSIILIITGLTIFKDSVLSLINKNVYNYSKWLIVVCIATIIIKFILFIYANKVAKKYHNILIKANAKDHMIDMIITSLNLISFILNKSDVYYFDGIVGMCISIWIIYSSIGIFKESYDILMDKCISNDTKKEVLKIISKYKEVKKINHFNSTPVGYQYQISFTIFVDGKLSTYESHEIADRLEKEITNNFDDIYLTVIHVNPIDVGND